MRCGAGCVLFTSDAITFPFKLGLGMHSINWAALKALAPLLRIALEKGLEGLQVFGDFELRIDWEKGNQKWRTYSYIQFLIRSISWWVYFLFYLSSMFTGNTTCRKTRFQRKNWSCWRILGAGGRWRGWESSSRVKIPNPSLASLLFLVFRCDFWW